MLRNLKSIDSYPAGSSFLFEPVMVPVPASVADKLLLSASVSRPAFDLAGAAVTGLGMFQILLEEASAGSGAKAAGLLAENGFVVYELTGGLGVWAALGYPIKAGAAPVLK